MKCDLGLAELEVLTGKSDGSAGRAIGLLFFRENGG